MPASRSHERASASQINEFARHAKVSFNPHNGATETGSCSHPGFAFNDTVGQGRVRARMLLIPTHPGGSF